MKNTRQFSGDKLEWQPEIFLIVKEEN
jgi:hypothetical protein